MDKIAIIIGAGPAGLTAAYELVTRTAIKPIILEKTNDIGGLSKTVVHNGNRIDIGGHRFFSKSDVIMKWWQNILPLQGSGSKDDMLKDISYHHKKNTVKLSSSGPDPEKSDDVMLIRKRLSRIFFLRKFFDYPITINAKTIANLGFTRIFKIAFTYLWVKVFRVKHIKSLEDFFISRFGTELYKTFFKDYTKKVWGVPCNEIAADFGAQHAVPEWRVDGGINAVQDHQARFLNLADQPFSAIDVTVNWPTAGLQARQNAPADCC